MLIRQFGEDGQLRATHKALLSLAFWDASKLALLSLSQAEPWLIPGIPLEEDIVILHGREVVPGLLVTVIMHES